MKQIDYLFFLGKYSFTSNYSGKNTLVRDFFLKTKTFYLK